VAVIVLLALVGSTASGQTRELRWNPALDVSITLIGAAAWMATEAFDRDLAPSHCRWCSVEPMDAKVRDGLIWSDTIAADTISDVTGFVLMPLTVLGLDTLAAAHDRSTSNVPEDTILVAEATVVAEDVTQLTKFLVGRERPFVHALPLERKPQTDHPYGNNVSFFSGHASEVFALATASGTISTMRGYRYAPLTWSAGGVIAITTAYLRLAADKHWLTDVVVGAAVGAAIGFATPYLFHSTSDESPRTSNALVLRTQTPPTTTLLTVSW
jgi:membrane-associated phospholipid phosphatase